MCRFFTRTRCVSRVTGGHGRGGGKSTGLILAVLLGQHHERFAARVRCGILQVRFGSSAISRVSLCRIFVGECVAYAGIDLRAESCTRVFPCTHFFLVPWFARMPPPNPPPAPLRHSNQQGSTCDGADTVHMGNPAPRQWLRAGHQRSPHSPLRGVSLCARR